MKIIGKDGKTKYDIIKSTILSQLYVESLINLLINEGIINEEKLKIFLEKTKKELEERYPTIIDFSKKE
ncbi:MAG: hypothetical protein WC393_02865 [Candidatus Nanoarchaeia archaeon]|jgi:hypothetical protein